MTDRVVLRQVNAVSDRVDCDPGVAQEIQDAFSFKVPGYQWTPAYKFGKWDGTKQLFNAWKKNMPVGLRWRLWDHCKKNDYDLVVENNLNNRREFSEEDALEFYSTLGLPSHIQPHEHQTNGFVKAVRDRRALLLSPTASGKSLIIYLLTRWYLENGVDKVLIIVPTVNLVAQMAGDFEEYGWDADKYVHQISSGAQKSTKKPVVISTWQSIYKLDREWFAQFDAVIGDEAHGFKAKSLEGCMGMLVNAYDRIGLTGTTDGTQTHLFVLEGHFGPVHKVASTKELMEKGHVAKLKIEVCCLDYSEEEKKLCRGMSYQQEVKFLEGHRGRNKFIRNLVKRLKGNTLVLHRHHAHGDILFEELKAIGRPVYKISGRDDKEAREEVRKIIETHTDAIMLASAGVFTVGGNIKRLHNVVRTSPVKGQIELLQSIGRGLRIAKGEKEECKMFDLGDKLTNGKSRPNHTLRHLALRLKIYETEGFDVTIHNIKVPA